MIIFYNKYLDFATKHWLAKGALWGCQQKDFPEDWSDLVEAMVVAKPKVVRPWKAQWQDYLKIN